MGSARRCVVSLLVPLGVAVACSAFAEGAQRCRIDDAVLEECERAQRCRVDDLFGLFASDLSAYERVEAQSPSESAEGATVEYYYAGPELKAVRSVHYGETGKTEIEYHFKSTTVYVSALSEFFYSAPISVDGSQIATVNQSRFAVCDGELVRGILDEAVRGHFERSSAILKNILKTAPR